MIAKPNPSLDAKRTRWHPTNQRLPTVGAVQEKEGCHQPVGLMMKIAQRLPTGHVVLAKVEWQELGDLTMRMIYHPRAWGHGGPWGVQVCKFLCRLQQVVA